VRAVPRKKLPAPATIGTGSSPRFPSGMPKLPGATPLLRIVTPPSSKNDHEGPAAFAQTVAVAPSEALRDQIAESLSTAPEEVELAPEVDSITIESIQPEPAIREESRGSWTPSFVGRLRAPTKWRSKTWLGAWLVLTGTLAVLVLKPPAKRGHDDAMSSKTDATSAFAARPIEPSPRAPSDTAPSVPALAALQAPPSASAAPATNAPDLPLAEQDLRHRGLGFLTVHSTSPYAGVYLGSRKYGRIEQKLLVRCGERFVAIGLPRHGNGKDPVWLAPGKAIDVPCGGSLDVSMNPRRLRPRRLHDSHGHSLPSRAHHR
jgi:hypothetical protein